MEELRIIELYNNTSKEKQKDFLNNIESSIHVKTEYNKTQINTEWIDKIEFTIPYIENIFRNPNRFIINEEEIVKIELARKITVDSIKHLSKHTNLIQDINKDTGDVRPSKILNINKEESYDTYENRLIYTLVQNIKIFINQKKRKLNEVLNITEKNEKLLEYTGNSKYKDEKIQMNFQIMSKTDTSKTAKENDMILERIKKLEQRINDVTSLEVYKIIDKRHISLVRPPIKKTNVVLKNVNFQYAVILWNYIQQNMDDEIKDISDKQEYTNNSEINEISNETFLLNYLLLDSINKNEDEDEESENKKENFINQMLDKIVELESSLTEEQLKKLIGDKLTKIKIKKMATIEELQKIYMKHIDKYLERLRWGWILWKIS